MSSGVRFRCYPKGTQGPILSQWIGNQRFIYNSKVDEGKYFRTFRNHSLSMTGQHTPIDQQYSQFKDKDRTPFLYEVPSKILRNGAYRYMLANSRFCQGLAGRSARRKKYGRQTVMITNQLFEFVPTGRTIKTQECGFTANADYNASLVIKKRGIKALLDGTVKVKQKKSVRFRKELKSQIGQGLPEFKRASTEVGCIVNGPCVTGQETTVRRKARNTRFVPVSVNHEAPTLTASCG